MSQVGHQAGFCSMKRLGVFLLPTPLPRLAPGWDVSPSQSYPQRYSFIHLGRERHFESSVLPKNTMFPARALDPETSALTMWPPCLQP